MQDQSLNTDVGLRMSINGPMQGVNLVVEKVLSTLVWMLSFTNRGPDWCHHSDSSLNEDHSPVNRKEMWLVGGTGHGTYRHYNGISLCTVTTWGEQASPCAPKKESFISLTLCWEPTSKAIMLEAWAAGRGTSFKTAPSTLSCYRTPAGRHNILTIVHSSQVVG